MRGEERRGEEGEKTGETERVCEGQNRGQECKTKEEERERCRRIKVDGWRVSMLHRGTLSMKPRLKSYGRVHSVGEIS